MFLTFESRTLVVSKSTNQNTMKSVTFITSFIASIFLTPTAFSSNWMHYNQANSLLPSDHVTAVLCEGDNNWIGTDNGLAVFDGLNWTIYTSEYSDLPDDYVRDIHKDNYGNIWVATDGGLLKIADDGMENFTLTNSNIPSANIRSVNTDSEGNVWIGTWGQGIAAKHGSTWTVYNTDNSDLPSDGVFTIEIDDLGVVWVGTYNGGVSKFNGLTWETFDTSNSELPHNHVRTITINQSHVVWFGTENGIARKTPNGEWDIYQAENIGYSFHTIHEGIVQSPGVVFFATDGGILRFVNSTFSMVTSQNSNLPSNNLRSMGLDADGNMWVGSGTDGISIYSPEGTLGIKDEQKGGGELTVYPNPTLDDLTIKLPLKGAGQSEIRITNGIGQTIIEKPVSSMGLANHTLNVKELPRGTYFVTVYSEQGIYQARFQKL
jgi:ligand-binding sensor domain-containing protein